MEHIKLFEQFVNEKTTVHNIFFTIMNESDDNWSITNSVNLMLKSSETHPYYGKLKEEDNIEAAIALAKLCLEFAEKGHVDEAMNLGVNHWKEVIETLKQKREALTEYKERVDLKHEDTRLTRIRHFQGSFKDFKEWLIDKMHETNI